MSEGWRETAVGRVEADITTFWMLSRMAFSATKLWNTAVWKSREAWKATGKIPSGYDLQRALQGTPHFCALQSHVAQKAVHEVGEAYRSWFRLRKKDRTAHPPGFRAKQRPSPVTFDPSGFRREPGTSDLLLSVGANLREALVYPRKFLRLKVRWWREPKGEIVEVRVVPRKGFFEVHASERLPEPQWRTAGTVKAIDLGVRNPVAIADEEGRVEIFRGGAILSTLRYWNKEKARVQSEVVGRTDGKRKWSDALGRMSERKNHQVRQAVHALTKTLTDACSKSDVKEVVVGELKGIKKEDDGSGKRWAKKTNQMLQQFPLRDVVRLLRYKLARSCIRLVEVDESGTSKGRCSACGCEDRALLRRTSRGTFECGSCGVHQHADANGARNILHRYLHRPGQPGAGSSGRLASPRIRRWNGHRWAVVG